MRRAVLVLAMLLLGLAGMWSRGQSFRVATLLPFHLPHFLAGFLLADLYITGGESPKSRRSAALIVPLAFGSILATWRGPAGPLIVPPLILVAYAAVLTSPFWRARFGSRWVVVGGGMCYTTYLYHDWIYLAVARSIERIGVTLTFRQACVIDVLVAAPIVFAASAMLYVLFEKPFMRKDWPARLVAAVRGSRRR